MFRLTGRKVAYRENYRLALTATTRKLHTIYPPRMLAVQSQPNLPKPAFKPIIEATAIPQVNKTSERFNPKKHLAFTPPEEIIRMRDIGYPEDAGVSPVAVSQPFRLFSKEAVEQMRAEVFNPTVMENCVFRSNIAACQIRGYCPQ
jgi:hypothetical protein